jgi:hypothetical protein
MLAAEAVAGCGCGARDLATATSPDSMISAPSVRHQTAVLARYARNRRAAKRCINVAGRFFQPG